jgi:hypothetical protein
MSFLEVVTVRPCLWFLLALMLGTACQDPVPAPPSSAPAEAAVAAVAPNPVTDAGVAEKPQAPASDEDEDVPAIAAYPPVKIEAISIRRSGSETQLLVRMSKVKGAARYELQASRSLLFEQLVAERSAPARAFKLGPIGQGMVFVHARAAGPAGIGPFGDVKVVDPSKKGAAAVTTVAVQAEPLIPEPAIAERPTAERPVGETVIAAPAEAASATDRAAKTALTEHYARVAKELADIEVLRRDLQAKVDALEGRLARADVERAATLKAELRQLGVLREQLDREVREGQSEAERLAK